MRREYSVIEAPLITEKGTYVNEIGNQVVFQVRPDANKIEIKRAVERQFKLKVAEVRVARMHGKQRRQGRFAGRRPDWKKAYVRLLDKDQRIEFFEGM